MLKNHFIFAYRHLKRRKGSTLISAAGLIGGIAAFLFILQFVTFEFSANSFHKQKEQIYRLLAIDENGEVESMMPPGVAQVALENIPGVENATRFTSNICSGVASINDENSGPKSFREGCVFVDENLLDIFTHKLIDGNGDLSAPNSALLVESTAKKYFGSVEATGKTFSYDSQFGNIELTVSGVLEDFPPNSDYSFNLGISFNTLKNPAILENSSWANPDGLDNGFTQTFLLLEDEAQPEKVASIFNELKSQLRSDDSSILKPQKFTNLHLAPSLTYTLPTTGNIVQVLLVLVVGVMIMIIAWANYVNLSTAQGMERAKQIGIQKTLGATKTQLVLQFLGETLIFSLLCLILALGLVELLQPYFNQLINKELTLGILNYKGFWIAGGLFLLLGVIISGGYVSFVLTSEQPNRVLKGNFKILGKGLRLRQSLVVFQFVVSIVFIIIVMVFNKQLNFMQTKDLGVALENRLVIRGPSVLQENDSAFGTSFKGELSRLSFVRSISGSNNVPGNGYNFFANGITNTTPEPNDEKKSYAMLLVDQNYLDTYNINLVAGKTFSKEAIDLGWASNSVILNESAAKELGFEPASSAVDQNIKWGQYGTYSVAGIIKDYHHISLQEKIDPMILLPLNANSYFTIQIPEENISAVISEIGELYKGYFPGNPFEYFFIQNRYDEQYSAEIRFQQLFVIASMLAIIIACLGLFGLAAYTANSRTKEIGIRKVLGATVSNIVLLLSKEFLKLVLIGYVIAAPLAAYIMNEWLQNFAYRTELGGDVFILSGLIAFLIAMVTVSGRALKTAFKNPVNSLKSD
jgi:putative ABC transport system permease protein